MQSMTTLPEPSTKTKSVINVLYRRWLVVEWDISEFSKGDAIRIWAQL
jgi:hypothetical protein